MQRRGKSHVFLLFCIYFLSSPSELLQKAEAFHLTSFQETNSFLHLIEDWCPRNCQNHQNKVLVAAAVASAIRHLYKPSTSVFYGNGVDFKATVRSGGGAIISYDQGIIKLVYSGPRKAGQFLESMAKLSTACKFIPSSKVL